MTIRNPFKKKPAKSTPAAPAKPTSMPTHWRTSYEQPGNTAVDAAAVVYDRPSFASDCTPATPTHTSHTFGHDSAASPSPTDSGTSYDSGGSYGSGGSFDSGSSSSSYDSGGSCDSGSSSSCGGSF